MATAAFLPSTTRRTLSRIHSPSFFAHSLLSTDTHIDSTSNDRTTLSVAIVGSGPSGCYTAKYLTSQLLKEQKQSSFASNGLKGLKRLEIDVLDRLPTPFGLVRNGVAPDHPEVKNVEHDFSTLFQNQNRDQQQQQQQQETQNDDDSVLVSSIEFRGNVDIGTNISLSELSNIYDVVVLAYGCESDRHLTIPGTDLNGILSAREFVNFYNGHVEYTHLKPSLQSALKNDPSSSHVVVIGQGNVALDCARICAKGRLGLVDTDIASQALEVLEEGVFLTTVLGRRGHVQGAFTIKELRELTKMQDEYGATLIVRQDELDAGMTKASKQELTGRGSRPKVRINDLLQSVATSAHDDVVDTSNGDTTSKSIQLRFLLNPIEFKPDPQNPSELGSIVCERTQLEGDPGQQRAVGTGDFQEIQANLALVSIGYKGVPLPDMDPRYFDSDKGTYHHKCGKVDHANGLYVSGWIKRGPMGIIGSNIVDSKDTVYTIVDDLKGETVVLRKSEGKGRASLDKLLKERGIDVVDWSGFEKIDFKEKDLSRRRSELQPREKIVDRFEMIKIAQS